MAQAARYRTYTIIALLLSTSGGRHESHEEVKEWMESLGDDDWDRVVVIVDRLASLGSNARMPFSRSLGDGLFELRFTLGSTSRARKAAAECAQGNP